MIKLNPPRIIETYDSAQSLKIAVVEGTKVTVTNGKIPVIDKNGDIYGVNEVEWDGKRWVSPQDTEVVGEECE